MAWRSGIRPYPVTGSVLTLTGAERSCRCSTQAGVWGPAEASMFNSSLLTVVWVDCRFSMRRVFKVWWF